MMMCLSFMKPLNLFFLLFCFSLVLDLAELPGIS